MDGARGGGQGARLAPKVTVTYRYRRCSLLSSSLRFAARGGGQGAGAGFWGSVQGVVFSAQVSGSFRIRAFGGWGSGVGV